MCEMSDRTVAQQENAGLNRGSSGSNPLAAFRKKAFSFHPHYGSLSCKNEYLAIDRGGNMYE